MPHISPDKGDKQPEDLTLFGGSEGWSADDWTASDDRVRGGKSESYLEIDDDTARFHGTLDIETLGGAGFASQRTTGDDRSWDLSDYAGIQLNIAKGDKKRYTFNLKDDLLPPDETTGREQSTISWECDFELPPQTEPDDTVDKSVFIPWSSFNPTYRGKPQKDAEPLKKESIKRISIMMRSFFGTQQGDFSLKIKNIKALVETPSAAYFTPTDSYNVRDLEAGKMGTGPGRCHGCVVDSKHLGMTATHKSSLILVLGALAVGLLIYNNFITTRL